MNEKENVGEARASLANTPSKKKLFDSSNNTSLMTNGSFVDQTKLLCCTGPDNQCPVHEPNHNRLTWGYFNSPDELETLIDSLNSRGLRESELKKMLLQEKPRILSSMEKCTSCLLNPSLVSDINVFNLLIII
jgi:bromodomain adjacent to zinc finger domain protein 1A